MDKYIHMWFSHWDKKEKIRIAVFSADHIVDDIRMQKGVEHNIL